MNTVAVVIVILIISIHSQSVRALNPARGLTSPEWRWRRGFDKKSEVRAHQTAVTWSCGLPGSLRTSTLSPHPIALLSGAINGVFQEV